MVIKRSIATPLVAGAFFLSAVTGVLIFFHADMGLNKFVHEWLSWILLAGAGLHVATNWSAFKKYFAARSALAIMGVFVLVLALSFFPASEGKRSPPFVASVNALSEVPITTVALVAQKSPEMVTQILAQEGFKDAHETDTLRTVAGPDMKQRMHLLEKIFSH